MLRVGRVDDGGIFETQPKSDRHMEHVPKYDLIQGDGVTVTRGYESLDAKKVKALKDMVEGNFSVVSSMHIIFQGLPFRERGE